MKRIISLLLVIVSLVSVLSIGASAASKYADVKGHWGQSYVDYYTEQGVVNGYPDGTFRPDDKITRAEAAQVLLNYFKFTGAGKGFTDVKPTDWYYNAVLAAQQNGAFEGYADGTFKPANNITRQEVIVMLRRITTAEEDMESGKHFIDYFDAGDWAKGSIGALRNVGVLDGYEEIPGTFYVRPARLITRAEFVKLLFTIEKSPNVNWQVPGQPVQPDQPIIIPGGGGGTQTSTYYNVEVSISGHKADYIHGVPGISDAPVTVGPKKRYTDSEIWSVGSSPVLADVAAILAVDRANDQTSTYIGDFQTAFGNNLAHIILKDMLLAYAGKDSVRAWSGTKNGFSGYVDGTDVVSGDATWKTVFSNPEVSYSTAVGTNNTASGYSVAISFTTPAEGSSLAQAYADKHNGGQFNGFYYNEKYTVIVTIYSKTV